MKPLRDRRPLVVPVALSLVVLAVAATSAWGASTDAYVHTLLTPPRCVLAGGTPDPSQPVCSVGGGPARQALTSQSVLVGFLDVESSQSDCAADVTGVETVATVDGVSVDTTDVQCRFVPQPVDNLSIPVIPGWVNDTRYVIPAGSLTPGTHTLSTTITYTVDVSYSLGCDDPSGRCTHHAGETFTFTKSLIITS
jgi:hypothetical protein